MSEPTDGGRARAYQALRESEELHRLTVESISDAVFITDDDGRFTFICPNVDVIFGYAPDEVEALGGIGGLLGESLFDRAELRARRELHNIERDITTKSGERRSLLVLIKEVSIQRGTVLYVCRDVTERKQVEEELRAARLDLAHASRLAMVGELMASIAHEINQPLTSIIANAGAGLRWLDGHADAGREPELRDVFADVRDQARQARSVIERLRTLAGKRPLERQPLDLNEVAGEILRLVGGDARRRRVALRTELVSHLPPVSADRVSLQQVVLNLLLNAMDSLAEVEVARRQLVVRTRRLDDAVELAVSDTGAGIPADRLPRLFEAFFTTKRDGLGLGLAIARSIVEAHGGRIWAEDHEGAGATFRLTLPPLRTA
jgi:PAS domain S-box-containing protein